MVFFFLSLWTVSAWADDSAAADRLRRLEAHRSILTLEDCNDGRPGRALLVAVGDEDIAVTTEDRNSCGDARDFRDREIRIHGERLEPEAAGLRIYAIEVRTSMDGPALPVSLSSSSLRRHTPIFFVSMDEGEPTQARITRIVDDDVFEFESSEDYPPGTPIFDDRQQVVGMVESSGRARSADAIRDFYWNQFERDLERPGALRPRSNSAPRITQLNMDPRSPLPGDEVRCSAVGNDEDGDPVEFEFSWTVDDREVGEGIVDNGDTSTLSEVLAGGESIRCTVTPRDGWTEGESVDRSAEVVEAPRVSDVRIEWETVGTGPTVGSTLQCRFSYRVAPELCAREPDAARVRIRWEGLQSDKLAETLRVGCSESSTHQSRPLESRSPNGDVNFRAGSTLRCVVEPVFSGRPDSSEGVRIENSPPMVSGVRISPENPSVDSTLSCSFVEVSDADDSDPEATAEWFRWTVDGEVVPGVMQSARRSRLDVQLSGNETVQCSVTPFDGIDRGPPVSSRSVRVEPRITIRMVRPDPRLAIELRDASGRVVQPVPVESDGTVWAYRLAPDRTRLNAMIAGGDGGESMDFTVDLSDRSDSMLETPSFLRIRTTGDESPEHFWSGPVRSRSSVRVSEWTVPGASSRDEVLNLVGNFDLDPGEVEEWTIDLSRHPATELHGQLLDTSRRLRTVRIWTSVAAIGTVTTGMASARWGLRYRHLNRLQSNDTPLTDRDEIYEAVRTFEEEGPALMAGAIIGGFTTLGIGVATSALFAGSRWRNSRRNDAQRTYEESRDAEFDIEDLRVDD